jgi:autophagy-related protein 16
LNGSIILIDWVDSEAIQREEALLDELDSAKETQQRQDQLIRNLREQITAIKNSPALGYPGVASNDSRKYSELLVKYEALKEEQGQLYRTQSQNVQRLLELGEQVKAREAAKASLEATIQAAMEEKEQHRQVIEELNATMGERDLALQVMQDELTALQLELLKTDERIERLEGENKDLVSRWMQKVSETADMLNDQLGVRGSREGSVAQQPRALSPRKCPSTLATSFAVAGKKELINTMILSPGHCTVALCTTYNTVGLHALKDGEKTGHLWGGPKTGIASGAFNTAGDLFAGTTISGSAGSPSIFVWHVPTEKIRAALDGHDGMVAGAAFLPGDDTKLATVGQDRTARIWDLPRGFCLRTFELPAEGSAIIALRNCVATGHRDGSVGFWDERVPTGLGTSSLHPKAITNLAVDVSSASDALISASLDHSLKVMECNSRRTLQSFAHANFRVGPYGTLPAGCPSGKFIAAGSSNGDLFVWNRAWGADLEAVLEGHKAAVVSTVCTRDPEGRSLIASADRNGTVMIWQ